PFHRTTDEPATKFVPFTVNVNAAPPAVADVGLRLVVVGTGFAGVEIVNVWAFEVPPPGAGLNTVTDAVPAVARSVAGMDAVSCDAETNFVVRLAPFHRTTDEPATKFVPFTVNVNAATPTEADIGLRLVVVGTGFGDVEIVNVWAFEVPPPGAGLNTITDTGPAVARAPEEIAAVTCDGDTKVVAQSAPFQRTIDPLMKFVPFTVSVNGGPPAVTDAGFSPVVVGTGLLVGGAP